MYGFKARGSATYDVIAGAVVVVLCVYIKMRGNTPVKVCIKHALRPVGGALQYVGAWGGNWSAV